MQSDQHRQTWFQRVRGYRIARLGMVIPPKTRVDPAAFSEDEFPVVCPRCNYQLRGLTVNTCPECGRGFERGRLLVEQYVIEGGRRHRDRTHTRRLRMVWLGLLGLLGVNLLTIKIFQASVVGYMLGPGRSLKGGWIYYWPLALTAGLIFGSQGAFIWAVFALGKAQARTERLVKRVSQSVDRGDPVFRRAQRTASAVAITALVLLLAVVVIRLACNWRRLTR